VINEVSIGLFDVLVKHVGVHGLVLLEMLCIELSAAALVAVAGGVLGC